MGLKFIIAPDSFQKTAENVARLLKNFGKNK